MEALKPRESGPSASPEEAPDELRGRAVQMVFETPERTRDKRGPLTRVAQQLGIERAANNRAP